LIYNIKYHALYNRIAVHKWPLDRAFNQPVRGQHLQSAGFAT
jgi:hypothetical protein